MDINEILQAINTVGFPIVCCIVLAYLVYRMNESHKEEIDKLRDVLNNNTIVVQKLTDKLDNLFYDKKGGEDGKEK